MKDPEILIQVDDTMPLGELLSENKDPNQSIKRSAHIGNMFGADLILASLGMNMLLVDANYGERDKLYFPQLKVDELNQPELIACSRTLSLANTTTQGESLNDVAVGSLVTAFGNKTVCSDSEFVASNKELVEKIVAALLPGHAGQFTRIISSSGMPVDIRSRPQDIDDVLLLGNDASKGAIIPNVLNILIDFAIEAINYQTDRITHISGPTMVKYINGIMPLMNDMYSILVNAGLGLPETLHVRLVPAAGVRFVVAASQASTLEEILSLQEEYALVSDQVTIEKKALATTGIKPSKSDFDAVVLPQRAVRLELQKKLGELPQLFFVASPESNTPTFTSQYSAIRNGADGNPGAGLYIPDRVLERPIAKISAEFAQLEVVRKMK